MAAEIPEAAVQAAAEVLYRDYESEYNASHLTWRDFAGQARQVLTAAASAAPPPAGRDALEQLAAKWKQEADDANPAAGLPSPAQEQARRAAVRQKRICTRQLLDALGTPILGAIAGAE